MVNYFNVSKEKFEKKEEKIMERKMRNVTKELSPRPADSSDLDPEQIDEILLQKDIESDTQS